MSQNSSVMDVFQTFQEYISKDQDIREEIRTSVREIEQTAREMLTILQKVHHKDGISEVAILCSSSREKLELIKNQYKDLISKIPDDQYYRFHDLWRFVTQRLVFLCAFIVYLESSELLQRQQAADMLGCKLGLKVTREEGFHIDLDDFLMGLLLLANELSRLAVNSVTAGDFTRPLKISTFVSELDAGFRLLNLKNDFLRKRYDGLKYDLKKIEEVVYDVSIRGLVKSEVQSDADKDTSSMASKH